MPIYEFQCFHCDGERIKEEIRYFKNLDDPAPYCPGCGGQMVRQISVSTPHLWTPGLYDAGGKRKEWIETRKEWEKKIKNRGLEMHGDYGADRDSSVGKVR